MGDLVETQWDYAPKNSSYPVFFYVEKKKSKPIHLTTNRIACVYTILTSEVLPWPNCSHSKNSEPSEASTRISDKSFRASGSRTGSSFISVPIYACIPIAKDRVD